MVPKGDVQILTTLGSALKDNNFEWSPENNRDLACKVGTLNAEINMLKDLEKEAVSHQLKILDGTISGDSPTEYSEQLELGKRILFDPPTIEHPYDA